MEQRDKNCHNNNNYSRLAHFTPTCNMWGNSLYSFHHNVSWTWTHIGLLLLQRCDAETHFHTWSQFSGVYFSVRGREWNPEILFQSAWIWVWMSETEPLRVHLFLSSMSCSSAALIGLSGVKSNPPPPPHLSLGTDFHCFSSINSRLFVHFGTFGLI